MRRLKKEDCTILTGRAAQVDLRSAAQVDAMAGGNPAAGDLPGRGPRRRHPRQRHPPGRIPLRQHDDRGECHRRCPQVSAWRSCCSSARPASIPDGAAAVEAGGTARRRAGADQSVVRRGQDRRHQARPGLSPPIRLRLHLRHADQSLRPRRQFRSRPRACHPGADRQIAPGKGQADALHGSTGAAAGPCASFSMWRMPPTAWCI